MITREKLQLWIEQNDRNGWGSDMSTDDETEVLKLALAHLDSARARRVGEAVLRLVADDSFDAYDLGVEVREIVDAFGGEP